MKSYQSKW